MTTCCCAKIIGGDMQIDLRACDEAMSEQITDRDQADTGTDQMSRKGVPHAMRREANADAASLSPCAHALIDSAA